ncbi:MAG: outer membrane protein assembly factor BamE [Proteobacteria bacterium]|nr:MAG: outer membrane protein assembly factor BamE [Pseudomonadota bacterium]MBC6943844.1 outer membrane protein assembly factor BamE [Gammaproteobacteria bacterium]MCE7895352.1 outer membrane protein assembly factor BamE [Gammaproteobacteria bacterium PRO8]MDL1880160.1 outer membrane protein assembly factor BamE [Gammaproteobacteria bacterium PRO2]MCL4776218.1 outer membrane protein assembly factor BamE [Gammaproteobacteria bacterium]
MIPRSLCAGALRKMPLYACSRRLFLAGLLALASGCVYRIDVQQGNLLDDKAIDAVQPGMTRSQVRFLLGTPVVEDSFHHDRWDYVYYLRRGRSNREEKRWVIVTFADDKVATIRKDVPFDAPG